MSHPFKKSGEKAKKLYLKYYRGFDPVPAGRKSRVPYSALPYFSIYEGNIKSIKWYTPFFTIYIKTKEV